MIEIHQKVWRYKKKLFDSNWTRHPRVNRLLAPLYSRMVVASCEKREKNEIKPAIATRRNDRLRRELFICLSWVQLHRRWYEIKKACNCTLTACAGSCQGRDMPRSLWLGTIRMQLKCDYYRLSQQDFFFGLIGIQVLDFSLYFEGVSLCNWRLAP